MPASLRVQERKRAGLEFRASGWQEFLLNDIVFSVSRLVILSIRDKYLFPIYRKVYSFHFKQMYLGRKVGPLEKNLN